MVDFVAGVHGDSFNFHRHRASAATLPIQDVIVDLASRGTSFQPVSHRQDADAALGFDARLIRDQIAPEFLAGTF
jgi:hypothetical protein